MEEEQTNQPSAPTCPVGQNDCEILADVFDLRERLDNLSAQVRTDPLTGLGNYRFFLESLIQEIERTQRSGQPTSLIMLDIDFFKKVNDTWGHEIGNQALVHIAGLIVRSIRKLDIPCRYGGEEFAVILPDTSLRDGVPVAERIRALIEETPLPLAGQELEMTVSLGLSTYLDNQQITPEELVQHADDYLYQAKQSGRNRVCHAELPRIAAVSSEEKGVLSELFGSRSNKEDST